MYYFMLFHTYEFILYIFLLFIFAVIFIKINKKIKLIIISFTSILILYSVLLIYKPIYIPSSTNEELLSIKITQGIFIYYRMDILHKYGFVDYKIKSADLGAMQDKRTYAFVQYDIKPTKFSYNNWNAGNGETGKDGWLLDKSTFYIYKKIGSFYFISEAGTGI